jgi:hypothetical protein
MKKGRKRVEEHEINDYCGHLRFALSAPQFTPVDALNIVYCLSTSLPTPSLSHSYQNPAFFHVFKLDNRKQPPMPSPDMVSPPTGPSQGAARSKTDLSPWFIAGRQPATRASATSVSYDGTCVWSIYWAGFVSRLGWHNADKQPKNE